MRSNLLIFVIVHWNEGIFHSSHIRPIYIYIYISGCHCDRWHQGQKSSHRNYPLFPEYYPRIICLEMRYWLYEYSKYDIRSKAPYNIRNIEYRWNPEVYTAWIYSKVLEKNFIKETSWDRWMPFEFDSELPDLCRYLFLLHSLLAGIVSKDNFKRVTNWYTVLGYYKISSEVRRPIDAFWIWFQITGPL